MACQYVRIDAANGGKTILKFTKWHHPIFDDGLVGEHTVARQKVMDDLISQWNQVNPARWQYRLVA